MADLTHFDEAGRPRMVDVSQKPVTTREASARGRVRFGAVAYQQIRAKGVKKGDIGAVAELAGIMGAKQTSALIPLCHPLPISGVKLNIEADDEAQAYIVTARVKTTGQTGVEMEALTAVSVACLTIYDMAKAIDKAMVIDEIMLVHKSGGQSGDFIRADSGSHKD